MTNKLLQKLLEGEHVPDVPVIVRYKGFGQRPKLGVQVRDENGVLWEARERGWLLIEEDEDDE